MPKTSLFEGVSRSVADDGVMPMEEDITLEETGDGVWSISFYGLLVARVDERDYKIRG